MKKLKSNPFKTSLAVLTLAVILLVASCAKKDETSPSGTATNVTSEQKSYAAIDQVQGPLILAQSIVVGGSCTHGGTTKLVTVNLNTTTCNFYINGGAGSLYYTWRTGSCSGTISSSTPKNVCSPGFCLTQATTYYLVISTGINGTGSSSPCYTVVVP